MLSKKICHRVILLSLVATLYFLGCEKESPTGIDKLTNLSDASITGVTLSKGGGSGPSVNGQGSLIINDGLQTFAFRARQKKDGNVTGSLEGKSRGQDMEFHGETDCLVVTGNTAIVGGVITQAFNGPDADFEMIEGRRFLFKLKDNGEGSNSPPDEFSDVFVNIANPNFGCPDGGFLVLQPIVNGNIQVEP